MGLGGHDDTVAEYVCQLPEQARKLALDELREDDSSREQSLVQFREWINKHPNIKKCRTGKNIIKSSLSNSNSKISTSSCVKFVLN